MAWLLWLVTLDPLSILPGLPGLALAIGARMRVLRACRRAMIETAIDGSRFAAEILRVEGVDGVAIVEDRGPMSDRYDAASRTLRLSPAVKGGRTVAALAIAALAASHAGRPGWRERLSVSTGFSASLGTVASWMVIAASLLFRWTDLLTAGLAAFSGVALMTLIAVPIEREAGRRAIRAIEMNGLIEPDQLVPLDDALRAATWAIVAIPLTTRRAGLP